MKNPFDTKEQQTFREADRRFVERGIRPHAGEWDEAGRVPWELHMKMGELGYFGPGIEERHGG